MSTGSKISQGAGDAVKELLIDVAATAHHDRGFGVAARVLMAGGQPWHVRVRCWSGMRVVGYLNRERPVAFAAEELLRALWQLCVPGNVADQVHRRWAEDPRGDPDLPAAEGSGGTVDL